MNQEIVITPVQVVQLILWICGAITAIGAAVAVIVKAVTAAKAPGRKIEQRISNLEHDVEEFRGFFAKDKSRLDAIEEGNRVTQKAILALLSHGIDGNDVQSLVNAKEDLTKYLIER